MWHVLPARGGDREEGRHANHETGGSRWHGSRPSSHRASSDEGKALTSINRPHDESGPDHRGDLFTTRSFVIFMIAAMVALLAAIPTCTSIAISLTKDGSGSAVISVASGFVVWWLVFLSIASSLHRLIR